MVQRMQNIRERLRMATWQRACWFFILRCWVSIAGTGTVWGYGAPVFVMLMVNIFILATYKFNDF